MAGTQGSAAASKEHRNTSYCAEPTWLGSSASAVPPGAQYARLLPTSFKNYKSVFQMVPQTDVSSLQPHVNLVRGKSQGYSKLNAARSQHLFSPPSSPLTGATLLQASENWAVRLPTSPSTYQVPKPRWGWAWRAPPGYCISLPSTGCMFQLLPSEAVSDPSFAGNSSMFHSSMENTQLVRTSRISVVQYFIKEEIYTPLPGRVEQQAQGMSLTAHLRQCLCKEKKSRFCEERVSELGCAMEHSENPATVLAAETPSRTSPEPSGCSTDILQVQQKEEATYCA